MSSAAQRGLTQSDYLIIIAADAANSSIVVIAENLFHSLGFSFLLSAVIASISPSFYFNLCDVFVYFSVTVVFKVF